MSGCGIICVRRKYLKGPSRRAVFVFGVILIPKKLPTPCSHPGCPSVTYSRYCDQHKNIRREEDREYKAKRIDLKEQAFYKTFRWRKLRAWKLRQDPLCEMCKAKNQTAPAVLVHHNVAIKESGDLMSVENLRSLCQACHNKIHRRDISINSQER